MTETTAYLADTRISKEKLDRKTKQITADLVAEHKLKRELKTQMANISERLATIKLARKTLNA